MATVQDGEVTVSKKEFGFPSYPSNDDDSIIQADLTSATAIDGGDLQASTQTFTADGMDVNTGKGVLWTGKTDQLRLCGEGTLRFEVDAIWTSDEEAPGVSFEYMLSHMDGTAAGWELLKEQANPGIYPRPTASHSTNDEAFLSTTGKDERVVVHVTWDYGEYITMVDSLPVNIISNSKAAAVNGLDDRFTTIIIGGDRTNAGNGPNGHRIKNFEAIAHKLRFPPHPEYASTTFFGDSITVRGNFSVNMGTVSGGLRKVWFAPGYGYTGGVAGSFKDAGLQCAYFREMFKNSIFPGACYNEASAGEATVACLARVNTFFDTNHNQTDVVSLFMGTNDCQAPLTGGLGSLFTAGDLATVITDYKSIITKLNTEGVKKVVCVRVPTLSTHASFTEAMNTNVDSFNAEIDALPAWVVSQGYDIDMGIADVFNALGGHTGYADYFPAGDIHPDELGSNISGKTIANAMLSIL